MGNLVDFCKDNGKICIKAKNDNCTAYNDPKIWEKVGGCPLNSIPSEIKREADKAKKLLDRNRFKKVRR